MIKLIHFTFREWLKKENKNENIENKNNTGDDMKKVEYEGKEYYIHEDTNDVSSVDDYELVGKWDAKEKRILWLSQIKKENNHLPSTKNRSIILNHSLKIK